MNSFPEHGPFRQQILSEDLLSKLPCRRVRLSVHHLLSPSSATQAICNSSGEASVLYEGKFEVQESRQVPECEGGRSCTTEMQRYQLHSGQISNVAFSVGTEPAA